MVVGDITEGVDTVVIGAGPGGYLAAIRLAQLGRDVKLIEKDKIGGVCLNDGCIPSKALVHASELLRSMKDTETGVEGEASVDPEKLQEWKEKVVDRITSGVETLEDKNGVEIIEGNARLKSGKEVHINTEMASKTLKFDKCIIATGSSPVQIPGLEPDGEKVIGSKEALKLKEIPGKFVIVGGGYIGMELGMVYSRLGSEVTVVEAGDSILSGMDSEAVRTVQKKAEEMGMEIVTGEKAEEAVEKDGRTVLKTDKNEYEADKIMVAVGRKPNTEGIGLGKAGVELDGKGFIETDETMKTSSENIYAIGDVAGQPLLAHKAYYEGKVAAEVIAGEKSASDYQAMPYAVYTEPEIAGTGLSEEEAEEQGFDVRTGRFPLGGNGRAVTMESDEGFVKVIGDRESGLLLGAVICGENASEMVSELSLGIEMGALVEDLAMTIHPHPTVSEAVMEACEDFLDRSAHRYKQ